MLRTRKALWLAAAWVMLAPAALADWNEGDDHKMHFPQLPDPTGWDVYATFPKVLADDWKCPESGPVSDIHLWGSWERDFESPIRAIHVSIHADDRSGDFSKPGELLWERNFFPGEFKYRPYGQGDQGWYNPNDGYYRLHDHFLYHQINITDIKEPFFQKAGNIYWLDVTVVPENEQARWGWKTSRYHFEDDAVWGDFPEPKWQELRDPINGESLDLAFVITPEPQSLILLAVGGMLCATLRRRQ